MTAMIQIDLAPIIPRLLNGEYASHIANELGIDKQTLSNHLRKLPDWQHVLETAHESRMDDQDKKMCDAIEERDFDLARAHEALLKRREWRASVECQRWSVKSQVSMVVARASLDQLLGHSASAVIDAVAEEVTENDVSLLQQLPDRTAT